MEYAVPVHPGPWGILGCIEYDPAIDRRDQAEMTNVREKVWLHNA
jgi:hypothetical protein